MKFYQSSKKKNLRHRLYHSASGKTVLIMAASCFNEMVRFHFMLEPFTVAQNQWKELLSNRSKSKKRCLLWMSSVKHTTQHAVFTTDPVWHGPINVAVPALFGSLADGSPTPLNSEGHISPHASGRNSRSGRTSHLSLSHSSNSSPSHFSLISIAVAPSWSTCFQRD